MAKYTIPIKAYDDSSLIVEAIKKSGPTLYQTQPIIASTPFKARERSSFVSKFDDEDE